MPKVINFDHFAYVSNEAWRALMAIEMGMKNHEVVPAQLIQRIARSKRNGSSFVKMIRDQLFPIKLVAYETDPDKCVSGYRLTNLGYDYLALNQLIKSGILCGLGRMIGSGKESDVYLASPGPALIDSNPSIGDAVVVKFHRLGRTSFRKVKQKRDYHQHRGNCSWLYLSRLAAQREFEMMKALHAALPASCVPAALAHNRATVVMSYVANSVPLNRLLPSSLRQSNERLARLFYKQACSLLTQLSQCGLVHADLNEFNLLAVIEGNEHEEKSESDADNSSSSRLVLIDFPQVVSRDHYQAEQLYERDAIGVVSFFRKFIVIDENELPPISLKSIERTSSVDVQVKAPGHLTNQRWRNKDQQRSTTNVSSTLDDVLLGASARLHLSSDESDSEAEEQEEEQSESDSPSHSQSSSECTESEDEDDKESLSDRSSTQTVAKSSDQGRKVIVGGGHCPLDQSEVRQRIKHDNRKRNQANFRAKIERHQRVKAKSRGRAAIEAHLNMFD